MSTIRPFKHIKHKDLWLRCSHGNTMLVNETLQLAWEIAGPSGVAETDGEIVPAGIAFDPWCRLYRSIPGEGRVERVRWANKKSSGKAEGNIGPVDLFHLPAGTDAGDFTPDAEETPLNVPLGMTVDGFGNLFIAESGAKRVLVHDLMESRLLRKVDVSPHRPLDCDHLGQRVFLLLGAPLRVMMMEARLGPWDIEISGKVGGGGFGEGTTNGISSPGGVESTRSATKEEKHPEIKGVVGELEVDAGTKGIEDELEIEIDEAGVEDKNGSKKGLTEAGAGRRLIFGKGTTIGTGDLAGRVESGTLPAHGTPSRIAVGKNGIVWILFNGGKENAVVVPLKPAESDGGFSYSVDVRRLVSHPFVTDLIFMAPGESALSPETELLVLARRPGEDFPVLTVDKRGDAAPHSFLTARNYDGRGIARTPDNRIVFRTKGGYRHAVVARVRYKPLGQCTTFALDSGVFRTVWGRIFIDACIPEGAMIRVHCHGADDLPENIEPLARTLPHGCGPEDIVHGELSPPMPPRSKIPVPGKGQVTGTLYRRTTGNEGGFTGRETDTAFAVYEAPVAAEPGRYLWVTLELSGGTRCTPRVKSIRVEHPSHDLLERLPKIYSHDRTSADFLRRYLAMFEGEIADLSVRAKGRHALLDPSSAPGEILSWLADFVGLVMDARWPEAVQRKAIAEAPRLFRFRGTVKGLKAFLGIYLGREPLIIEHFRVRGKGGAIVGPNAPPESRPLVGAGFRVGGAVGPPETVPLEYDDGFDTHAHRFSVVLPVEVTDEEMSVVREILERHRPAHTLYEICTVDAGMRVGIGLYLGFTSMVGTGAGFGKIQVGASLLGRGYVLWRRPMGVFPGSGRIGKDTRTG